MTPDNESKAEQREQEEDELAEFEEEAIEPFAASLARTTALLKPDDSRHAQLQQIAETGNGLFRLARDLIESLEEGDATNAEILAAKDRLEDAEDEFIDAVVAAIERQNNLLDTHGEQIDNHLVGTYLASLFAILVVLLIGLAAWRFQDKILLQPLAALETAANDLAQGNLEARVSVTRSDEIGRVATTFNNMAQTLSRSISTSYLNGLIDSIPDPLIVVDRSGEIVRTNQAANQLVGAAYGQELNAQVKPTLTDIVGPDAAALLSADELSTAGVDFKLTTPKAEVPYNISAASLATLEGARDETVLVFKDMTHWIRTLNDLQRSNDELSSFAYIASHDLKSPLRAISNLSTWIAEDLGTDLDEEIAENIRLMRSRVVRMESLIDGILEYSRIGQTELVYESIDVNEIVEQASDTILDSTAFSLEITTPLPTLSAPAVQLEQVFSNLIANAVKHHDRDSGRIEIACEEGSHYYRFTVTDDGPGIDPAYHERVFGIFQTLASKDIKESTGVGLALVKRIVEEHGGTVSITSKVGEGAAFTFTWPREAAQDASTSIGREAA